MATPILMCPPEHYGVFYEINPWMDTRRCTDHAEATRQWNALHAVLRDSGAEIHLLPAEPGVPDLVFTANAALMFDGTAFLSHFRHPQRQLEEPFVESWFREAGYTLRKLPADHYFEGAGDALFCGQTLIAGYRFRSEVKSHQWVAREINRRVIPLELVDPYYYHLDTCFCPLSETAALYFPGAFDEYGRRALRELVPQLIAVEPDEARQFACNAVVVGQTVVTNTGCPQLHAALREIGFQPRATPLDEFVKAGGSAKCLTLRLDEGRA